MLENLEPGQSIGAYEVLQKVDALGFGAAYKVRNNEAGRIELMRVLPKEWSGGFAARRFSREAKILQNLVHPNIVVFYRAAEIDGRSVLTTELPEGRTLEHLLHSSPIDLKAGSARTKPTSFTDA
jgi:serine/threonine protein kinase